MNKLYLASQSFSRKEALEQIKISYEAVEQDFDERECDWCQPLPQLLKEIALNKMKHAKLPKADEGSICYVLTADTMGQDYAGKPYGKPLDTKDAIAMIKALREGGRVGTAFCLDRKKFKNGSWEIDERVVEFVEAHYTFSLPDHWVDSYLENEPRYLKISGAITIVGYGQQFLETVEGSYGAIVGLPLYEVRVALEQLGFFEGVL